jgi:CheY-like chemotaxis protein
MQGVHGTAGNGRAWAGAAAGPLLGIALCASALVAVRHQASALEMAKLRGLPLLCVYGTDENESLCPRLPAGLAVLDPIEGGHPFGGEYTSIARRILEFASAPQRGRNPQPARAGARRRASGAGTSVALASGAGTTPGARGLGGATMSTNPTSAAMPAAPSGLPGEPRPVEASAPEPRRILLAEDDLEMRRFVGDALRRRGYLVIEAANGTELIQRLTDWLLVPCDQAPFDLVISDHRMPGFTGLGVLRGLQSFRSPPPFIVITAFGGSEFAVEAQCAGARAVLDKPFDSRVLLQLVTELIGPARS